MRAGYEEMDITPQPGEEMSGYGLYLNRRARGTLDPLRARVAAIESEGNRAAVVSLDLVGLDASFVSGLRREAARMGLSEQGLMLHCIHTHSGPATYPYRGCGALCEEYVRGLSPRLLLLIEQAFSHLSAVRRCRWFDEPFEGIGFARAGSNRPDSRVRGIAFDLDHPSPLCIVSYACHPVVLGRNDLFSADYPGRVMAELNAYGIHAVFLNGPCGDVDPLSNAHRWGCGSEHTLNVYGRDLARAVRQGLTRTTDVDPAPLRVASRPCQILGQRPSLDDLTTLKADASERLRRAPDAGARLDLEWAEEMLDRLDRGTLSERMAAEVQVFGLGTAAVVGLAGEVFTGVGQRIREALPGTPLILAATTNGLLGYIPTREDIQAEGYASNLACKIYRMLVPRPGEGERFADQAAEVVRQCLT